MPKMSKDGRREGNVYLYLKPLTSLSSEGSKKTEVSG